MKLKLVILFVCLVQFSEEKPTAISDVTTTTGSTTEEESSTVIIKPGDEAATVPTSTEKPVKKEHSSDVDEPPKDVQLPVDLLSDDILLDPSVILARAEREVGTSGYDSADFDRYEYQVPEVYFLEFVRAPRSLVPEENQDFRMPNEPEITQRRFSRSLSDDLDGAEDGFIIRPLFKYRHEQAKKFDRRVYRDTYRYYPRYPIFPGK